MEDFIFHFNDKKALSIQCDDTCKQLYDDIVSKLIHHEHDQEISLKIKEVTDKFPRILWLARYGSAVLVSSGSVMGYSMDLVGLDRWQRKVHASTETRGNTAYADVMHPAIFSFGEISKASIEKLLEPSAETSIEDSSKESIDKLLELFQKELQRSEANTGDNRRQSHGHSGNQKTPSFAYSVLYRILWDQKNQSLIQGGTTDVGLHTGCQMRNTSFPLVLSIICVMLRFQGEPNDQTFYKCLVVYFLDHLQRIVERLESYEPRQVDRAITVVREIEEWMEKIHDKAFKTRTLDQLEGCHARLVDLGPVIDADASRVTYETISAVCANLRSPKFPDIPDTSRTSCPLIKLQRAKKEAQENLNWSNLSPTDFSGRLQDAWINVHQLNCFFWSIASKLQDESNGIVYDISGLRSKVERYARARQVIQDATTNNPYIMSVVVTSCETLAIWISYCWADRVARATHRVFMPYSCALDPDDLDHLVLDDARAIRAVEEVRSFLRFPCSLSARPFRREEDTLAFALAFGNASEKLKDIYRRENRESEERISKRYEVVRAKQSILSRLDSELRLAENDLSCAIRARQNSMTYDTNGWLIKSDYTYRAAVETESTCREKVQRLKSSIAIEEQKPADLSLPLPRDMSRSLQWLFFLYMPKEFRDLSALAHLAQSKMWKKVPSAKVGCQDLLSWFNSRKTVVDPVAPIDVVELSTFVAKPQSSCGHIDIRNYTQETGVFFPDMLTPAALWKSTNPFEGGPNHSETVILYTETLPNTKGSVFMQQFVPLLPGSTRGNQGIAQRKDKPDWLTREAYCKFATLRAFPNNQIRELVTALREDTLPFEHPCVHVLVQQLLYHIGQDSWKADFSYGYCGFRRLAEEMELQATILAQSPKDSNKLMIFGLLSSFLGQYSPENLVNACRFGQIACKWADEMDGKLQCSLPASQYWKQARFYGYAILCHSTGKREHTDYVTLAKLIVLFRHKMLFVSGMQGSEALNDAVIKVMASRVDVVIRAIESDLSHLTECLASIITVPSNLNWVPVMYDGVARTGCFEAVCGQLFSVNLLNGTVLVDGVPPGFLPQSVVDDPLYQRTFSCRNFESVVLGPQHYRTARPVENECFYEFLLDSSGLLHILECRSPPGSSLDTSGKRLLLRSSLFDLPALLRGKYSHWYNPGNDLVILRGVSYRERRIEYVMSRKSTYVVPLKNQNWCLAKILEDGLESFHRLVMGPSLVGSLLQRFETNDFIHIMVDPKVATLRFWLPRYKLTFTQSAKTVRSLEFEGFELHDSQILDGTLYGVTSYLILKHPDSRTKVIAPSGKILPNGKVHISSDWRKGCGYFIYDVHQRFGTLDATNKLGRLHLAGLYAASSSFLPERALGKCGTTIATDLVRQCWTNEPLNGEERDKLVEVSQYSNLSCTLRLMCTWIWKNANSLWFLHDMDCSEAVECLDLDVLAADQYRQNKYAPRLQPCEELLLLGTKRSVQTTYALEHIDFGSLSHVTYVAEVERSLRSLYIQEENAVGSLRPFPLQHPDSAKGLAGKVHAELHTSWKRYCQLPKRSAIIDEDECKIIQQKTTNLRRNCELALLAILADVKSSIKLRISQISGKLDRATSHDLMCLAWDDDKLHMLNPLIGPDARRKLRVQIIEWMMLCVLEDKLSRLARARSQHDMLVELDCIREWDPFEHPRWLAFETEQQLQIRPYQYSVVRQLLANRGTCTQLNMGLGKTRVLLPMLILELVSSPEKRVVRVTALSSIMREATEHMRSVLVASIQNVRIYTLPFHRDNALTSSHSSALTEQLEQCKEYHGCMLLTPQHRTSLLLKQYDVGVFVEGLKDSFSDVLDESDAILDHAFQLVYAIGSQVVLPEGSCRWTMIETLLSILARGEVLNLRDSKCSAAHIEKRILGGFPNLRFLAKFKELESATGTALCKHLVNHPPLSLKWMNDIGSETKELLVKIISDSKEKVRLDPVLAKFENDILAIRGCIAHRTLFHALYKRHRVDYGIDRKSERKMAVPFAASDTPKARSEFSHPDMAITYTCLSYYHDGLTKSQFKDALVCLQSMGRIAQEKIYDEWIGGIRSDMDAERLSRFDHILKVDVDNIAQLDQMHEILKRSMDVVSFWMNNFVFPDSTHQYPSRRVTNAWNLVDTGTAIGFSGTDDTRFLLPLSIQQVPPADPILSATNGEMIDRVIHCTREITLLDDRDESCPLWRLVVNKCVNLETSALIDVGGLMAGSASDEVAHVTAELLTDTNFKGVVYFCVTSDAWLVYEIENKRYSPLKDSSLNESQCFVYFDQSRCRGADMKLQDNACALVTLEPMLRKDSFLQGCMRMRKLRRDGQSLILAGTSETVSPGMTAIDVLQKILSNTVKMVQDSVVTYFERGMDFCQFPKPTIEKISLKDLYWEPTNEHNDISAYLDAVYERNVSRKEVTQKLVTYCKEIGQGAEAQISKLGEECEQEIEREVEREEENQLEIPVEKAYAEVDWAYDKAFVHPDELFSFTFVSLTQLIDCSLPELAGLKWCDKIFCTRNFWTTIQPRAGTQNTNLYVRPVNALLCLEDGRVVLISEYELDKLLPYWREAEKPKATLHHLCLIETGGGFGKEIHRPTESALTSMKLFRGNVEYSFSQKQVLSDIFQSVERRREVIQLLLSVRDRSRYLDRSDLDDFSSRVR